MKTPDYKWYGCGLFDDTCPSTLRGVIRPTTVQAKSAVLAMVRMEG